MDTALLNQVSRLLDEEHRRFTAAFCEESILNTQNFDLTCEKSFVLRRWCPKHDLWHVLPAKKLKPWRIVADCEARVSEYLTNRFAYLSPTQEALLMRQIRDANAEYFHFLKEVQDNCAEATKQQHRLKQRTNRRMQRPPQVSPEQVPRKYLIEFAICYRKVKYHDGIEAEGAITSLHPAEADMMNTYRCKFCQNYHIGHISAKRRAGKPVDMYHSAKRFWQRYPREADAFAKKLGLLA